MSDDDARIAAIRAGRRSWFTSEVLSVGPAPPAAVEAALHVAGYRPVTLGELDARLDAAPVCRVCGCTDDQACVWFEVLGDGRSFERRCSWVAPGLCSECGDAGDVDELQPLLYDAHGAPLARTGAKGAR